MSCFLSSRIPVILWVTLLTCIHEMPGSNLGRSDYPDLSSWGFPQFLQENSGIVHQIRPWWLPSTSSQIHYSLTSTHSSLWITICVTDRATKFTTKRPRSFLLDKWKEWLRQPKSSLPLCNPKLQCHVHNSPRPDCDLSHIIAVHIYKSYFFMTHLTDNCPTPSNL